MCDEVFGRVNYVATVIWRKNHVWLKNSAACRRLIINYILLYAKDINLWKANQVDASEKQREAYKNPDNDPRGAWQSISLWRAIFTARGRTPSNAQEEGA